MKSVDSLIRETDVRHGIICPANICNQFHKCNLIRMRAIVRIVAMDRKTSNCNFTTFPIKGPSGTTVLGANGGNDAFPDAIPDWLQSIRVTVTEAAVRTDAFRDAIPDWLKLGS